MKWIVVTILINSNALFANSNAVCEKLDSVYIELIDSLMREDQRVRDNKHYRANKLVLKQQEHPKASKRYKKALILKNDWAVTDSSNSQTLIDYIESLGFPSKERVGLRSYRNAVVILLHFDEDIGNKVLEPLLKPYLLSGEIEPSDYARIIDRHYSRDGREVYYEWSPCKFKSLSTKEKETVRIARKEIGLGTKYFKCSTFGKKEKLDPSKLTEGQLVRYENHIEKAREYAYSNSLDSSLFFYDSAFQIIDFIPYHYFEAFDVAVKSNNFDKAFIYLSNGTTHGLEIQSYYTESVTLFLKTKQHEKYLLYKDSLQQIYLTSIDTVYLNELELLKQTDQNNRSGDSLSQLTDSLNFGSLLKLIDQRGFPTLRKVGLGYNIAYLLLWHHRDEYPDSDQWKEIIPIIEKEIKKGDVTPKFFQNFEAELVRKNRK